MEKSQTLFYLHEMSRLGIHRDTQQIHGYEGSGVEGVKSGNSKYGNFPGSEESILKLGHGDGYTTLQRYENLLYNFKIYP